MFLVILLAEAQLDKKKEKEEEPEISFHSVITIILATTTTTMDTITIIIIINAIMMIILRYKDTSYLTITRAKSNLSRLNINQMLPHTIAYHPKIQILEYHSEAIQKKTIVHFVQ